MSSEQMRQLIESIEKANTLTEGYEERVQQVADKINQAHPDGITKKELPKAIKAFGGDQVEMRGSERARKDFMKDVEAKVNKRRDTSKADAKRERINDALFKLSNYIQDAVSNSYPDGDPFDTIFPKARKMGIPVDDVLSWLDRAAKKHLDAKSYHDYLNMVWDSLYQDAKSDYENISPDSPYYKDAQERYKSLGGDDYRSPWR